MSDAFGADTDDCELDCVRLREEAVRKIKHKNRLKLMVERLASYLEQGDETDRAALVERHKQLHQDLSAAEAEVVRLKQAVQEAENRSLDARLQAPLSGYCERDRMKAKELMIEREQAITRLIENPLGPPHRYKLLSSERNALMADIHEMRSSGKNSEAEALIPRLDQVLEEIEVEHPKWLAEFERRRREATAPFDAELANMKEPHTANEQPH